MQKYAKKYAVYVGSIFCIYICKICTGDFQVPVLTRMSAVGRHGPTVTVAVKPELCT